ncbi:helix-turn-helix domain-containing protein [Allocoprobacillus halotolerans]|uniref:helix-turn-helix domain-containing protein n=1 Tax=Allocoprobacillus halotolerans TaxID=2944914 RepID=UPI00338DD05D
MEEVLDQLENETLFEYLKHADPIVSNIILLKQQGYNVREISQILGISMSSIYRKIKKVKKLLKM